MKTIRYKAKTKWAGLVWIWGNTLNKIPKDGILEIQYEDKSVKIPRSEIKSKVVREKQMYNALAKKPDTQYGFVI